MRTQWPLETEITGEVDVKNIDEKVMLFEILRELKKLNLQISFLHNERIDDDDF